MFIPLNALGHYLTGASKPLAREIHDSDSEADFTGPSNPKTHNLSLQPHGSLLPFYKERFLEEAKG